jgi:hypothetical protein
MNRSPPLTPLPLELKNKWPQLLDVELVWTRAMVVFRYVAANKNDTCNYISLNGQFFFFGHDSLWLQKVACLLFELQWLLYGSIR